MYEPLFNQRQALRFRHFTRKGYALFACLGRVVTIGVLSVATLQTAAAASDELHQFFVPGRSGEFLDVLLDSAGVAVGVALLWLLLRKRKGSA